MSSDRDYNDIESYQSFLIGETIESVELTIEGDEGLKIQFESGKSLDFGFSGCEGSIIFNVAEIQKTEKA